MSETQEFEEVRAKDHDVLICIRNGENDVRALNEALSLSHREINYALVEKLEPLGLIEVHASDGWREEVIDGQVRKFRAPKSATLTEKGLQYFAWADRDDELSRQSIEDDELVEMVQENRELINAMKQQFTAFVQEVREELDGQQEME